MKRISVICCLLTIWSFSSYAQFNYSAASVQHVAGTYVDLGTSGNTITINYLGGALGNDDDVSALQDIGFNFSFNGLSFNKFYLNTNGFIKLANIGTVAPPEFSDNVLQLNDSNILAPFNMDLIGGAAPEFRVLTSGSAGSRICTVQFKGMADFTTPSQYSSINFQIRLFETSNQIEFVYGLFSASASPPAINNTVCGIKGNTDSYSVNVTKFSDSLWSRANFIDGAYVGNKLNNKNSVLPDVGRTFRFVPIALFNNDAGVEAVYTLGELPINYGFPHAVSALIRNKGINTLNNVSVTLSVSGANSYADTKIIPALAPGASSTVTFASFTASSMGSNIVTVSLPSDDNNINNSKTVSQAVGAAVFSYADQDPVYDKVGLGTNSGTILVKYHTSQKAKVTQVRVHISSDTANKGKTVYAVVANGAGAIIGSSSPLILSAADLNAYKTFDILASTQDTIPANADFYVGLAQLAQPADLFGYLPVSVQKESSPARSGAYYSGLLTGGTPLEVTDVNRLMIQALVVSGTTPVDLYSFSAFNRGKVNHLNWQVENETDMDTYLIERSGDDFSFSVIGTVKANHSESYAFIDELPGVGNNYYRINMRSNDGSYKYSPTKLVKNSDAGSLVIFPNPVPSKLHAVHVSAESHTKQVLIYSIEGKLMYQSKRNFSQGAHVIDIPVDHLPAGVYRLIIQQGSSKLSQHFIKL